MAFLLSNFTAEMNRRHGWDGPLFRGRFHNRVAFRDEHWMHLLAYLHMNPVRANLVLTPDQAHWISHGYYSGRAAVPGWFTVSKLTEMFEYIGGYGSYVESVQKGVAEIPDDFDTIAFRAGRRVSDESPGPSAQLEMRWLVTPREALAEVVRATGATYEELMTVRRGREGNLPRILAAYWLVFRAGITEVEAGRMLSMKEPNVSKAIRKVRNQCNANARLESVTRRLRMIAEMEYGRV
jgi:hypothetical protein